MARDRVGDLEQARRCFQESFDLADKLLDADPSSGSAAGDVMTALNGLAASYRKGNQPGIANGFETDYRTMIGQAQSQRMRQNFRLMTLARRAVVHLPQNSRAPSLIWFRSSMPDVAKLADVYKDRPADFEEAYYNVFVWPDETALRLDEQTLLKALKEAREEAQKSDGPSAWRSWTSHAVGKLVSLGVDQQNAIAYMEAVAAAEKAAIRAMVAAAETRINERAAKPE